jgi:hypothetical protein
MIRGDLSNRLVHLTRGTSPQEAAQNFVSIFREGALRGSNGHIRGGFNCVCFSEAPLGVLTQALAAPPENGMRYSPFGVIVSKSWLFQKGGRPVIYQAHDEYDLLADAQKFRHVRYEPHRNVDHTWEREWRIQTDSLALEPSETTFVVPTRAWERRFHQEHIDDVATTSFLLEIPLDDPMPWHFVVLEDLGVEGFDEYDF